MKAFYIVTALFVYSFSVSATLLDKIAGVFNDQTISYSQIQRMHLNLEARQNIAPMIYQNEHYTDLEMLNKAIEKFLVRSRLEEMGYFITDDQVESQIRSTERRLGVTRRELNEFLASNNITFDEYFEIIRETIEFNIFNENIIGPLISITEQEIKNAYYEQNIDNQTVSFNYHLINYSIATSEINSSQARELRNVLEEFQQTGNLPSAYRRIRAADLGQITEDGMNDTILQVVRRTHEGEFTDPVILGDAYHVFYIKERDIVESSHFRRQRPHIQQQLYAEAFERISRLWFERQANRHYISINL